DTEAEVRARAYERLVHVFDGLDEMRLADDDVHAVGLVEWDGDQLHAGLLPTPPLRKPYWSMPGLPVARGHATTRAHRCEPRHTPLLTRAKVVAWRPRRSPWGRCPPTCSGVSCRGSARCPPRCTWGPRSVRTRAPSGCRRACSSRPPTRSR